MRRRRRIRRRERGRDGMSFDQHHEDHSPLVEAMALLKKTMKATLMK